MSGMVAIITGGTAGLGLETAVLLARQGFEVIITGRSPQRAREAKLRILADSPQASVTWFKLDQSDLREVVAFSRFLGDRKWDLLINNAGAKIERPYKETKQGLEWHIGVNHIAHVFLSQLLISRANPKARVVFVSSIVARRATFKLGADYSSLTPAVAYSDSKLGNLVSAMVLNRLLNANGISVSATAAHPGFARASRYGTIFTRAAEILLAQSAKRGALSVFAACFAPAGSYSAPRFLQLWGKPKLVNLPKSAGDEPHQKEIWNRSLRILSEATGSY